MSAPAIPISTLRTSYRRLYKAGLAAVQYSTPARYVVREKIRSAFRQSSAHRFSPVRIDNTVEFLNNAAAYTGIEHKIVRNISMVDYYRLHWRRKIGGRTPEDEALDDVAYNSYLENIGFLNQSLELDLR